MRYCKLCLYPDTKPDLTFNEEGICSACIAFEARKNINWEERELQFQKLLTRNARNKNLGQPYDCVIPVSGGKDSHYQVLKALEYGLNPLCVTALTDHLSDIGNRNLHNISKLGVDHIIVSTNAKVRRRINRYTLETIGDISWAEHVTIFTVPIREAILRNITLIIWGENPQNEYGGPNEEANHAMIMERGWLNEFGGLNGLRVQDIIDAKIATRQDMYQYAFPVLFDSKLEVFPTNIFLGQYFEWDGLKNAEIARENGFEWSDYPIAGNGTHYENLDNAQTGIHDRFKYLKFGFNRATDIACNAIRRGRMTREEGIIFVERYDNQFPIIYAGVKIEDVLKEIGMTVQEYTQTEVKFMNNDLFNVLGDEITPKFKVGQSG